MGLILESYSDSEKVQVFESWLFKMPRGHFLWSCNKDEKIKSIRSEGRVISTTSAHAEPFGTVSSISVQWLALCGQQNCNVSSFLRSFERTFRNK